MKRAVAFLLVVVGANCARPGTLDPATAAVERAPPVSAEARRAYLRAARVFDDVDPSARDVLRGPPAFAPGDRVSCSFVEPRIERVPAHGTTPKFFCTLRHGPHEHEIVKVKYGRRNGELYGEVLGSRLLWALGVATDDDYAVHVTCHHCPSDPWRAYRDFPSLDTSPRRELQVDDAVVQRLYPGAVLEQFPDQGWSFAELPTLAAPRAELDALRLLAAFIAHGDDKPENQRLVCEPHALDPQGRCRHDRLLIADLGSTFGRGANAFGWIDARSRPTFAAWSALPVWSDRAACRVDWATRALREEPMIGEAGRAFLARRLAALSHAQIRDLFVAARIERLGETVRAGGVERAVTVDDWARAFERKRAEIVDTRCPP